MNTFLYTDEITTPDSSAVAIARYNHTTRELVVTLRSGGSYRYTGVPSYVWNNFSSTPSKGSYYANVIKEFFSPATSLPMNTDFSSAVGEAAGTTQKAFPLSSDTKVATNTTSVVFEINGSERTADFAHIDNVDDAVAEINRIAGMMGLDPVTVKEVTVHFSG